MYKVSPTPLLSTAMLTVLALSSATVISDNAWADSAKDRKEDVQQSQGSAANFVETAATSNMFEVESSKVALERSRNQAIRDFAQMMINDHSQAQSALKGAVKTAKVDPSLMPSGLDAPHRMKLDTLSSASDEDFDEMYVSTMQQGHRDAVNLFSDYAKNGENAQLKDFAANTLPTLEMHKEHVSQLDDQIR